MGVGDGYTGRVVSGGAVDVRELPALTIRKFSVSEMNNNVYLLTSVATGRQLLIDAADDASRILEVIASTGQPVDSVETIVTTHQHWDHVRALPDLVAATRARTVAGADDAEALPVVVDEPVAQDDQVRFGDITLEVVHLRGHTPGSIALLYRPDDGPAHLWSGDSLFPGGIGNTKNPGQSFASLFTDVRDRVFAVLDDDTWFYPGHGDDSTLGAERPHLAEWEARGW